MATKRRIEVAIAGAVTAFDHLLRLPTLRPDFGTTFVPPLGEQAGEVLFGGCGLNQAVALGRLGVGVAALGVVGEDFAISGYLSYLGENGVDCDGLVAVPAVSGHSFILHSDEQETLLVVEEGAATRYTGPVPPAIVPPDVRLLCLNMPFDEYACELAETARAQDAEVLIAGQLGTATAAARARLSAAATYVCCNRSEADSLGLADEDGLARDFPCLTGMWITEGAGGIRYIGCDRERLHVEPPIARLVDPTGAGDGVVAGITLGLVRGLPIRDVTRLGAVIASFVIEGVGAQTAAPQLAACLDRFVAIYGEAPLAPIDPPHMITEGDRQ